MRFVCRYMLLSDENMVAVVERDLVVDAHERPILGTEIGEGHLAFGADGDLGMPARDERVVQEVDVVALAPDGDGIAARTVDHPDLAAPQALDQLHLGGALGAGVEIRSFGVGLRTEIGRRRLDLQQLLADEKQRAGSQDDRGFDTNEDAVDRPFVDHV